MPLRDVANEVSSSLYKNLEKPQNYIGLGHLTHEKPCDFVKDVETTYVLIDIIDIL